MNKINIKLIAKSVIATKMEALDLEAIVRSAVDKRVSTELIVKRVDSYVEEYLNDHESDIVADAVTLGMDDSDIEDAVYDEVRYRVSNDVDYESLVSDHLDYSIIDDYAEDYVNDYIDDLDLVDMTREVCADFIDEDLVKECIKEVIEIE